MHLNSLLLFLVVHSFIMLSQLASWSQRIMAEVAVKLKLARSTPLVLRPLASEGCLSLLLLVEVLGDSFGLAAKYI